MPGAWSRPGLTARLCVNASGEEERIMASKIKGLTVEIGGDTTKLGKALEDVEKKGRDLSKELGDINRLLKMDPGNTDLLAQKQQVLADAVENTRKKLDTLRDAERQVQEQFQRGEVSEEQVRALQREIIATEKKMQGYENAAKETADALGKLEKETKEVTAETAEMQQKVSDVATTGFKALTGALTAAVAGLVAAAESTRDYRMEMGKLDTAFTDSGFSSEAATTAYKELVGVLGEYDQSVEAANHLAKLTSNEKELATWTGDILPGVFATFGDSLPIEGLTEAANETAKVGQVTGPLADALNWAGIAEDEFNESLAKCTTEQERQRLIMETLAGVYGDASAAYKETNADVIAANQANDNWMSSLAQVGAVVEPLLTDIKDLGATLLSSIVPVIEGLLSNLPTIAVAIGGITAAVIAFKIAAIAATAAQQGMTLAQYAGAAAQNALNVAMNANPIGLIILGITALVSAFMLLWNNCEGFREFWINLWEKIKTAAINAWEGIKALPEKIYNGIKSAIDKVKKWGEDVVSKAKAAATNMLNSVTNTLKNLPGKIWTAIVGAVNKVATWGTNMVAKAKTAASNMLNSVVSFLKQLPGKIWTFLTETVRKVVQWGSDMVSKAKTAATNLVSGIVNIVKSLPSKMLAIGKNLVQGIWTGISNSFTWIKNKISGWVGNVLSFIKKLFGIASPSKETAWMGEMLDEGLAEGMLDHVGAPIKAMRTVTGEVLGAAQSVDGLALERSLRQSGAAAASAAGADSGVLAKLDRILAAIEAGQVLAIDGDALVGATAGKFDKRLGQRRQLAARGALS